MASWEAMWEISASIAFPARLEGLRRLFRMPRPTHVPKAAKETLRKGGNVIAVEAINSNDKTLIEAGMIA